MNSFLLAISISSMVLQDTILNREGKKGLNESSEFFRFQKIMFLLCAAALALPAIRGGVSLYTAAFGFVFGVLTAFLYRFKVRALASGPMHITVLLITSSLIIPALSGVLFFGEKFNAPKMAALLFLIASIYVSAAEKRTGKANKKWLGNCMAAFAISGAVGILQKMHQSSDHKDELCGFLFLSFACAFVVSFISSERYPAKKPLAGKSACAAFVCGLCMLTMNILNLKLSGILPSQLFFPIVNGGAIVFGTVVSLVGFHEIITKRQIAGILGGIISIVAIALF